MKTLESQANQKLKSADYSLVSKKHFSQKIPSSDWHLRPGNLSQNGLKPTPLMTSPTKKMQNLPFFSTESRRLAASFERLNSSLAQWRASYGVAKWWENVALQSTNVSYIGTESVKLC